MLCQFVVWYFCSGGVNQTDIALNARRSAEPWSSQHHAVALPLYLFCGMLCVELRIDEPSRGLNFIDAFRTIKDKVPAPGSALCSLHSYAGPARC